MHQLFLVMRGIRRHQASHNPRRPKNPITLLHLLILFDFVSARHIPYDAAMLRTAMSFAFYGMLRVSEYTASGVHSFHSNSTLTLADIQVRQNAIVIFIKKSKTDPFRIGAFV